MEAIKGLRIIGMDVSVVGVKGGREEWAKGFLRAALFYMSQPG